LCIEQERPFATRSILEYRPSRVETAGAAEGKLGDTSAAQDSMMGALQLTFCPSLTTDTADLKHEIIFLVDRYAVGTLLSPLACVSHLFAG